MREIPSLQTLCLRSIGPHSCSAEVTFAPTESGEPSSASRLLRKCATGESIPRAPAIGKGSFRRVNANDIDMNHPITALKDGLVAEFGNPALDCLQAYIHSLVELGRMDDARLGVHFFQEYLANTQGKHCSLSLFNCTLSLDTLEALQPLAPSLAVLDLTGVHGLSDELLTSTLLPKCTNLQRLSLKNCRKITRLSMQALEPLPLQVLDIGGAYNITPADVLEFLPDTLLELHASGLGWTDDTVEALASRKRWQALSLGFSLRLTQGRLRTSLVQVRHSLVSLALPFCESVVDNTLMGMLGRNLPHLQCLDVRGNGALTTLTGWYDGRASADLPAQPMSVLGRYSGLSEAGVEETKRVHPLEAMDLVVILNGGGMGLGIRR